MNNDILFITAYKDINRKSWKHYTRTNEEYIKYFLNLTNNIEYTLIVYIENNIKTELSKYNFKSNIIFKNIELVDTFLNKFLDKDKTIINSDTYKIKIPLHRKNNPEHIYSEYNLINHSKINFVSYSKKILPNYNFYSWIDFGYVRNINSIPKNINISKLPNKVLYHCLEYPKIIINPNNMLSSDTVFITGSSYIIHSSLVDKFESLYEKKIIEWQDLYITDDDQNLVLQLFYENNEIFHLYQNNNWFSLFNLL